ncbi:uncharacterized protein LOC119385390 [Rhipicephalus sanguineus]|uniref:uncharacterized protein LOC119385390 n=1 Tax=Rhipicephalus sanguineus TaxID=34632 RepID=UPI001895988A|nr:uncharacterized protein LOC119385390 [Rhipicephalus sanguineus]
MDRRRLLERLVDGSQARAVTRHREFLKNIQGSSDVPAVYQFKRPLLTNSHALEPLEIRIDIVTPLVKHWNQVEAVLEARLQEELSHRLQDLQKAQQAADGRQRLLDEAEPWSPTQHCPLQELPLLRSSRDAPFRWTLSGYQRLKEESRRHGQPRLYSRPFGIEREGSVRCVLRLVACLGVPAVQEAGDALQLGLELLHSAKCSKKFDFFLRLLDRTGGDRHLVKSFSSSELAVPRYWFSRPALGVVSFAVLVSEQRMLREGLLSTDTLNVEVGLQ